MGHHTASGAGLKSVLALPAYVGSKHAVVGLTRSAAIEYVGDNVGVDAIAPGTIATPMITTMAQEQQDLYAEVIPMGRLGRPDEVADLAVYLLGDESTFITGTVVEVDGGYVQKEDRNRDGAWSLGQSPSSGPDITVVAHDSSVLDLGRYGPGAAGTFGEDVMRNARTRRRLRQVAATVVAFTVVATACGGDDDAGDGTAATDTTAASAGSSAGDEIDPTARFRWANGVGLTRFDPHRASSSNDNTHLFLTYDRLVHQDSTGAAIPGLAESWSFQDEGTVLELQLREGVVFHDGAPFDAEAVRANIERAQTVEGSAVVSELSTISSVEVVDDHLVRLHLTTPNAALPLILSDRAGAMVSPDALDDPNLDLQPVGAGMFRVSAYDPGSSITYDAFADYWDPDAVRVAGIDMTIQTDSNTRLNALRSGQVDATVLAPRLVADAEAAGLNVVTGRTNNYWYFQPNRARSEFGDVRVRQALWHAINRAALVDVLALGNGTLSAQPVPEWSFAHDSDIAADHYAYDPERARELLAEAGLADGFSFEAMVATSPEVQLHAEAIQADLAAVGIDMQMRILEGDQITDLFFVKEEGDLLMGPGGGRPDPAQTTGLRYTPGGFMNPGDHTTEEIERLQAAVITTIDEEARTEAFHELFRAVLDEALEVVLYFANPPLGMAPTVVGFDPLLADRPEFRGVAILQG